MKNLNADIAIAPLEINEFNKSKSNLKRLEYVVCGLPAVFTDIEPYKNAFNTAETEEFFIDIIESLVYNPDLRYKS
jgi:O-antigen biosynthesis protein